MWRANGNPNPCTDLDKILCAHPYLSKEGFGVGLIPAPSSLGPGRPKTLKEEGHTLKCSAGCKLAKAALGTSTSMVNKKTFT